MELGRGEEGVALVVTLAVFMFMYIFCAGVFAVGKMVKDRICLQNAADAAAYSAAVVQADVLSRLATINRAMSWTYAQMNRRRMDFIVYRWMEHAKTHYEQDRKEAAYWVSTSSRFMPHYLSHSPYHGSMSMSPMSINGSSTVGNSVSASDGSAVSYLSRSTSVETSVDNALEGKEGYNSYFDTDPWIRGSCYETGGQKGIAGLERQIDADMESIWKMNLKEKELIALMRPKMEIAAREILRANVPEFENCAYVVKMCEHPEHPVSGFLSQMGNSAEEEYRFLEWGNSLVNGIGQGDVSIRRYLYWDIGSENSRCNGLLNAAFGTGAGTWFRRTGGAPGFRWSYHGDLVARWTWNAWRCTKCEYHYYTNPLTGVTTETCTPRACWEWDSNCTHGSCDCACVRTTSHNVSCYADNSTLRAKYGWVLYGWYNPDKRAGNTAANNSGSPLRAQPYLLKENFFSREGTVTVGIARPNANPWRDQYVLGTRDANIGLYHAFDPFLDWMVCFASARAGYKAVYDDVDMELENRYCPARVARGPRDYCIDFKPCRGVARKVTDKWDDRYGWYKEVELLLPTWTQRWNLCQSDWDAVMIPVCRAGSGAFENLDTDFTYTYLREPCWTKMQPDYLYNLVMYGNWHAPESGLPFGGQWQDFRAGTGAPLEINDHGHIDYAPGDLAGLVGKLPERYHGWNADTVQRGGTTAIKWPYQWRVSGYGQRLNWMELQKQMLH